MSALLVYKQLDFKNQFLYKVKKIEAILIKYRINFQTCFVNELVNQKFGNNLIITIGGDGTLLGACRFVSNNIVLGLNLDPDNSVGSLCVANVENFEQILKNYLNKIIFPQSVIRLEIKHNSVILPILALNDILFTNNNPAAMTCYEILIGETQVFHRNSGLWICTPCGSTGATRSAGGQILNITDKIVQWICREPYYVALPIPKLLHGFLKTKDKILIKCKTNDSQLYIDGPHCSIFLERNDTLEIFLSDKHLNLLFTKESEVRRKEIGFLRKIAFQKRKKNS